MRAEWTRATIELGPTVLGTQFYVLPTTVDRILKVYVGDVGYEPTDEDTIKLLNTGAVLSRSNGFYWIHYDATGTQQVGLYPSPGASGTTIQALVVQPPAELDDDADVPVVPTRFHRAICDYAAAQAFGSLEDNPELRTFYENEFDGKVQDLGKLRQSRQHRGVIQLKIQGYHI